MSLPWYQPLLASVSQGGGAVAPFPNGDEQTFAQGATAHSTSNYAAKGNFYDCNTNRFLTKMSMNTLTAGQSVDFYVARVNSGYTIQEILLALDVENFTTVSGANQVTLATPILLSAGTRYAFVAVRRGATALRIYSDSAPNTDPAGHFTRPANRVIRHAVGSLDVGDTPSFSSSAAWTIDITTEQVGP